MRLLPTALLLLPTFAALAAAPAQARCTDDIEKAYKLTFTLPDNPGRNLLLRDIVRAQDALHESDPLACQEQIADVLSILRQSGRQ